MIDLCRRLIFVAGGRAATIATPITTMPMTTPLHRIPWLLIAVAAALVLLGLSAIERGDELAGGGDTAARQAVWAVIGLAAAIGTAALSPRTLARLALPLFATAVVLLVVVYFMPARNGARRWIPLGLLYFQPSELAKPAVILALAGHLRFRQRFRSLPGLVPPFLLALLPMALILKEPDLGTSLVFLPVLMAMLFAAGARPAHLVAVALLGVATAPVLWAGMNAEQRSRVVAVFTQNDGGPVPTGDGYHLHQSKTMLALGGAWGSEMTGMASDDPLAYHLPAGRTDFVFCLIGERWGLFGAGVTLALYSLLFLRGLTIAVRTREPFGRLVVVGVVTLLATQTLINTAMTVGLMPITGLTLPLMSYGGSSLVFTLASLGLIVGVAVRPADDVGPMPFRW